MQNTLCLCLYVSLVLNVTPTCIWDVTELTINQSKNSCLVFTWMPMYPDCCLLELIESWYVFSFISVCLFCLDDN